MSRGLLSFPQAQLKTKGDIAFAVKAPERWDDLPQDIMSAESVTSFKSLIKIELFLILLDLLTCFYLCFFFFISPLIAALMCYDVVFFFKNVII